MDWAQLRIQCTVCMADGYQDSAYIWIVKIKQVSKQIELEHQLYLNCPLRRMRHTTQQSHLSLYNTIQYNTIQYNTGIIE